MWRSRIAREEPRRSRCTSTLAGSSSDDSRGASRGGSARGGGEISAQFFRRATRSVPRSIALDAPPLFEPPGVDRIEPELVEQLRDGRLRRGIVSGDDQCPAVFAPCGLTVGGELRCVDMVEGLDNLRGG